MATGEVRQLTSNPRCVREYQPRWSPDDSQLTYWRWREDATGTTGTAVFVIDADGTGERQLTEWETFAGNPDWSPDGQWIAYGTYPLQAFQSSSQASNLFRMYPDGSATEPLTDNEAGDLRATQPRYTPDGAWIVFTAVTPSGRTLSVIPSDGGAPVAITRSGIYTHGTWQP